MRKRFHGLKKPKVRQSWSKYNLYNLSRLPDITTRNNTHFQWKWAAKSMSRAYHGEVIREKAWTRMFKPHPYTVIPMDYRELAKNDGSTQALGRGSGLDLAPGERRKKMPETSYMSMVYWPMERRLDTAVFRALFASSTRQARQFVVHGNVRVNGKKMIYPGYLLNPGDMFSVDPDRVLFATGASKSAAERKASRRIARQKSAAKEEKEGVTEAPAEGETVEAEGTPGSKGAARQKPEEQSPEDIKKHLRNLLQHAKAILADPRDILPAKRKQDLRAFQKAVKRTMSRSSASTVLTDALEAEFLEITSKLATKAAATAAATVSASSTPESKHSTEPTPSAESAESLKKSPQDPKSLLSPLDLKRLREALEEARSNPIDPTKPYATPWRPRPYMSAFAFIPRYLEVNQNICSAVYLRHPVARPGLAEVPTPFKPEVSMLAFHWYLRRR
ncbi:MAG: mitochondrial 37S ribosomal protein nam9 [Cirrosporium novae-zelandiae]|nr:MAG: mitochondrial 37S ribosomal protein nam9 [Cirrosporium novae-zelandiae]